MLFLAASGSFFHFENTAQLSLLYREDKLGLASIFFSRGNYYFGKQPETYDIEKAEWNFKTALRFENVHNAPIHYQLGRVAFIKGDLRLALVHFNAQLEADPTFNRSYYMRGLTYGYLNNFAKAEEDFAAYLERVPESWAAHNDIVWVYFRSGQFAKAEEYARKGLAVAPDNAWLSNALGGILVSTGRYDEAEPYLRTAREEFELIGPEGWGRAYPGNDPAIYEMGFEASLASVDHNLSLVAKAQSRE